MDAPTLDGQQFDVVVEGTDLAQCIVAAALAHAKRQVLVLDASGAYGGSSSGSLTAAQLFGGTPNGRAAADVISRGGRDVEGVLSPRLPPPSSSSSAVGSRWRFALDLTPRFYLGADALIDLLIRSGAASYVQFKPVDAVYLLRPEGGEHRDALVHVPSSKASVFASRTLSLAEKRALVRFLRTCVLYHQQQQQQQRNGPASNDAAASERQQAGSVAFDADESERARAHRAVERHRDEPFVDGLLQREMASALARDSIAPDLVRYVFALHHGSHDAAACAPEGARRVELYLRSMLRYGTPTPFLSCNHGSGELCQAFARRCAVKGGVMALHKAIVEVRSGASVVADGDGSDDEKHRLCVRTADGERIRCRAVLRAGSARRAVRFIGVRRASLFAPPSDTTARGGAGDAAGDEHAAARALVLAPPDIYVRQLDSTSGACPDGYFVVYAERAARSSDGNDDHDDHHHDANALRNVLTRLLHGQSLDDAFDAYAFIRVHCASDALRVQTAATRERHIRAGDAQLRADSLVDACERVYAYAARATQREAAATAATPPAASSGDRGSEVADDPHAPRMFASDA